MSPSSASAAGILVALITAAAAIIRKLLSRKSGHPKPEYISRAEFHSALDAARDRIGASYLALADKLDSHQRDLLAALERQGASFEHRLDHLESSLARLDERTRPHVAADARRL